MRGDFYDLKDKAENYNGNNTLVDLIKNTEYVEYNFGNNPVLIKYKIPIYNEVTYSFEMNFCSNCEE